MKIICVVGARPNFIKIAPIIAEIKNHPELEYLLVHTGQHYDDKMSDVFFTDLKIPKPDINMSINSGSQTSQIAKIMIEFENICRQEKPDLVLVVGDVNSTLACAFSANRLGIKVAHVEAGLRSYDRSMPEEVNRVLVDQISNYLLITEESARNNLIKEGISDDKIYFVGNVMIDSLISNLERQTDIISRLDLVKYCVVTLHRPSNVDDKLKLIEILDILTKINQTTNIVWPIHPRTKKNIAKFGLEDKLKTIKIIDPLGYLDFITLTGGAQFLLTDSGGIQEETTYLGVPCLTMRQNTERPITIEEGTNVLVNSEEEIFFAIDNIGRKKNTIPKYWDGKSAKRIIDVILKQGVDKGGENATLP